MIAALDSAYAPSDAAVAAARAADVRLWAGYIATRPAVGILNPWSLADFERVRVLNPLPVAYCSGWDDPAALRIMADDWRVRLCLDVEDGIRGDGAWVQGFLDASGAGIYGNPGIPEKYAAPFKIMAAYLTSGDPGATWQGTAPAEPHGWQWQGTHGEFGADVDRCWFDEWFGGDAMTEEQANQLKLVADQIHALGDLVNGLFAANADNTARVIPAGRGESLYEQVQALRGGVQVGGAPLDLDALATAVADKLAARLAN